MKKFDGIYLFTDVDGTLASVHDEIPQKNIEAVEYFTQNGGTFSVATGRYLGDVDMLNVLNINGLSILNNGACIYDFANKKIVRTQSLPNQSVQPLVDFCKANQELGLLIVNDEGYIIPIFDDIKRPIFHSRHEVRDISEIKLPYYKILIVENGDIYEIIKKLRKSDIFGIDIVQTGHNSIEIVPKNVSKGDTFLEICKKYDIKKEQTYFVGDSFNDVTMMQNAGFSGAMNEAHELVKNEADVVVCDFEQGSIYHMVKLIEKKTNEI
ncbi:MAG: HAD family hydrolase [Clostridia bacterium]